MMKSLEKAFISDREIKVLQRITCTFLLGRETHPDRETDGFEQIVRRELLNSPLINFFRVSKLHVDNARDFK